MVLGYLAGEWLNPTVVTRMLMMNQAADRMLSLSGGGRPWSRTATGTVCLVILVTLLNLCRQSYPEGRPKGSMRAYVPQAVVIFHEVKHFLMQATFTPFSMLVIGQR